MTSPSAEKKLDTKKRIFQQTFSSHLRPAKCLKRLPKLAKKSRARTKAVNNLKVTPVGSRMIIKDEGLDLDFLPHFYTPAEASKIFNQLEEQIVYNKKEDSIVKVFGKEYLIPRKQVAFGDPGLAYTFSGVTVDPKQWTPLIKKLKDDVTKYCSLKFNYALVNRYKDGEDRMGAHRDDENGLASWAIASLSFGAERDFILKHHTVHNPKAKQKTAKPKYGRVTVPLPAGSLLVMNPPTNEHWYHELPKRKRVKTPRVNLTFRVMQPLRH